MDLADYWVVGFSGKRQLQNRDAVQQALRSVLQDLQGITQGKLVALSSAAIGADLLAQGCFCGSGISFRRYADVFVAV